MNPRWDVYVLHGLHGQFSGYHFLICLKLTFSVLNWINSQTRDRQFSRKLQNKMRNVSNYNYSGGREKFQLQ